MPPSRHRFPRPALWIAVPVLVVGVAVIAAFEFSHSILVALFVSVIGALAVGCFAEGRLAGIITSIGKIAAGDRYTSLPKLLGDGAIRNFNDAAGKIRAVLM